MRLTKGIKKTLSVVLAAAMVIGGTATGGKISKAADEELKLQVCGKDVTLDKNNGVTYDVTDSLKNANSGNFGYVKSSANFTASGIKVKVNNTYEFTFDDKVAYEKDDLYNVDLPNIWGYKDGEVMATSTDKKAVVKCNSTAKLAELYVDDKKVDITSAKLTFTFQKEDVTATPATSASGEAATGKATTGGTATVAPTPTEDPYADYKEADNKKVDEGSMKGFQMYPTVGLNKDWAAPALKQTVVNVTPDADGNATAEIRFKATVDSDDMFIFFINSNLGNWSKISTNFKWAFKSVTVDGDKVEDVEDNQELYGAADGDIEKGLRYNVRNPWNTNFLADKISTDTTDNKKVADLFAGTKFPIKKDSEYVFTFEFTGMTTGGDYIKYTAEELPSVYNKDGVKIGELVTNPNGSTTINPVKPAETATGSATTGSSASGSSASGSSASGSSATPAATTAAPEATATAAATKTPDDSANKTATLKVAKTKLVIAPGKSVKVKVTSNTTFTASSSNKKVAKVKANKANVKISVPKSAKKGATANITVKAGKVKKVIKVTVANKVKKLKANKKKVTVKKGKTAKVVVKVTSQNKKAKTTDKLTVKTSNKKVAKIAKKSINKKKVVVKVKALKKGTSKITVKVGKKKVVVKVKVK